MENKKLDLIAKCVVKRNHSVPCRMHLISILGKIDDLESCSINELAMLRSYTLLGKTAIAAGQIINKKIGGDKSAVLDDYLNYTGPIEHEHCSCGWAELVDYIYGSGEQQ